MTPNPPSPPPVRSAWARHHSRASTSTRPVAPNGRVLAGVALVVALAVVWLVLRAGAPPSAGASPTTGPPAPLDGAPNGSTPGHEDPLAATTGEPRGHAGAPHARSAPRWLRAALPESVLQACRVLGPTASCRPGRGPVTLLWAERMLRRDLAAYARAARAELPSPAGPPACASGQAEARTWSWPDAPGTVAGHYGCETTPEPALWWTDDRAQVLVHVSGRGDLAALYRWWVTLPAPG